MTPYKINMLLHYYSCLGDWPYLDTMAAQDALKFFLRLGFLTSGAEERLWCITGCGTAYVHKLLATPVFPLGVKDASAS